MILRTRMKSIACKSLSIGAVALTSLSALAVNAAEPDWNSYDTLLQRYVKADIKNDTKLNWVHYSGLKDDPDFTAVVAQIADYPVDKLTTRQEKLAFYINAYNILAMKMVVDHWPVESIKDAGSFIYPVWYRNVGALAGKTITLNALEHDILRSFGEPRIHFAIVCASISCPDLRPEAYRAKKLDAQLNDQTKSFLNNPAKGLYVETNNVHVSKIFDWFTVDFNKQGGVEEFLRQYVTLPKNISLKTDITYNWSVNGE